MLPPTLISKRSRRTFSCPTLRFIVSISLSSHITPAFAMNAQSYASVATTEGVDDAYVASGDFLGGHALEIPASSVDAFLDSLKGLENRLSLYESDRDCARDVVKYLPRCGDDGWNEEERVQGAIAFTLCDIPTAPLECAPWVLKEGSLGPERERKEAAKYCIDALIRTPSLWSTFMAYKPYMNNICRSFLKLAEVDTAKLLYKDISAEKLNLLVLLQQHAAEEQRKKIELFDFFSSRADEKMESVVRTWDTIQNSIAVLLAGNEKSIRAFQDGVQLEVLTSLEFAMRGVITEFGSVVDEKLSSISMLIKIAQHSVVAADVRSQALELAAYEGAIKLGALHNSIMQSDQVQSVTGFATMPHSPFDRFIRRYKSSWC
ncbi:hypothetical protein DL93DRAFT_1568109 [Clavulina sp. PMI_390]|nr:hypothetical protein DL93DRAFT_1568109 [Clavulina sp. PMI_390]